MVLNFPGQLQSIFKPSFDLGLGFGGTIEPKDTQAGQGAAVDTDEEGQDVISVVGGGTTSSRHEYNIIGNKDVEFGTSPTDQNYQIFTVGAVGADEDHNIDSIRVNIKKVGTPGTLYANIYAESAGEPTGAILMSGPIVQASVPAGPSWVEINMASAYTLTAATTYALVWSVPAGGDGSNNYVLQENEVDVYPGGAIGYGEPGSWTTATGDYGFEVWGTPV